ncbi:ABC transporter substrate-binding protein [Pseudocnuella soli]|uniref:ABC transporter substrate-binding protein n=1 Tax=Pseudocnuella soli TaxID=2502779 RepID=UPI00104C539C|nr:ABC transporter substrate-binding protein [Pseudocnuella soli]
MKKGIYLIAGLLLLAHTSGLAQNMKRHKIALFAPLYLDSVFNGANYRYGKEFPKFLNPGLEFYQGAQMALDSLQKMGAPLEVFVYDTRSKRSGVSDIISNPAMNDVELIIANASNAEVRQLAEAALRKKVPLISATLPNDAGVNNNPYFVILNSTLRAHCEGIYRYLQTYHSRDKIVLFRKNGAQENQLRDYFNDIGQSTIDKRLAIETLDVTNGFNSSSFTARLDSTRRTVVIAGSLDQNFGEDLASELASIGNKYPITLMGMPTWENIRAFSRSEFRPLEIIYSTPFYINRSERLAAHIGNVFEDRIEGRPTDLFFRGYETMLRFAQLLLETKTDVASNLSRKGNYVFTQYDIQPVFTNKQSMTLDYFENKKLYFVRRINGAMDVVRNAF